MRLNVVQPGIKKVDGVATAEDASVVASVEEVPVEDIYTIDMKHLRQSELEKISLNNKAVTVLLQSLCEEEYGRVKACMTAKEIWDVLRDTHVGTSQVKDSKIRVLTSEYESFKMRDDESISAMHQRLTLIVNNLSALGKKYSTKDLNSKVLASLTREYFPKSCAIIESKDIGTLPKEELVGSLLAFEVELKSFKAKGEELKKEKKNLALQVVKPPKSPKLPRSPSPLKEVETSDEEDEMAMYAKQFKKFVRFQKKGGDFQKRGGPSKEGYEKRDIQYKCFECNKPGHMKADCPRLKSKYPYKKDMRATWENYGSGDDSEEEEEEEEEVANVVCFMANDSDEVTLLDPSSSYENGDDDIDLHEAFDDLCN